ncbi:hypothetical protein EMIHUDRAFT_224749 [Emiliania huxleyi CCMP1516]|uniref:Pentapeptide repeat-containing protein n=2 Tax=Emiliania huxleyi TaxID=2903 RepID=A0A0D3KRG4_EMIH1|nr:hypothetical protein EMIHUDRAFT_224749 [Emiliania huxleyi CCMP1516]EOD38349.1 hypothetical protein EMIHUDRAFT_224749 [Emiliania huxleyi CCMP1516]|eukprot:XP_005790778.1 hypothetical protein EMIHUDRAFT_224749 [Emiliania huxleyi CCMP1516]
MRSLQQAQAPYWLAPVQTGPREPQWLAPAKQGACRTAGGNQGSYIEKWGVTESKCGEECVTTYSHECVAWEFTEVKPKQWVCELHKDPVKSVYPIPTSRCYIIFAHKSSFGGALSMPMQAAAPAAAAVVPTPQPTTRPKGRPKGYMINMRSIRGAKPMGVNVTFDRAIIAIMRDASITDSDFPYASFDGAQLTGIHQQLGHGLGTTFDGTGFVDSNFTGSMMQGVIMIRKLQLQNANLNGATLRDCKLQELNMISATAVGADFSGSVLNIGCFDKADVSYSKFIGASVPDSTFNNTVIKGTDFTGALGTLKADFYHAIGVPLVCDGCNYPGSGLAPLPAPITSGHGLDALGSLGTVAARGKAYEGGGTTCHGYCRLDPTIASEG